MVKMSATEASKAIQELEISAVDDATNYDFQLAKTSFYKEDGSSSCLNYESNASHLDLVDLLAVSQWRKVDYLPMTWLSGPDSDHGLLGGTANIQQAPVDLQNTLACKRIHRESFMASDAESALRLLMTEVTILGHPIIRQHKAIARLEGICWDFQGTEVYPVLIFKKAVHGDLRRFMRTTAGRGISFDVRLRLCADIAAAIMTLHAFHIVHGDIKPENILIDENSPGVYSAKITDFGYSTLNMARHEDEPVALPTSWPWTAPEVTKENFILFFFEARRADYFSFGMLCLWLLFTEDLASDLDGDSDLEKLATLKNDGALQSFALNSVQSKALDSDEFSQRVKEGLGFFFQWTLEMNPLNRGFSKDQWAEAEAVFRDNEEEHQDDSSLNQTLVTRMGISYEDILGIQQPFGYLHYYNMKDVDLGYDIENIRFNLTESIGQLAAADFRLWDAITSCLERNASHDSETAFSLALLLEIGLGAHGAQSTDVDEWLLKSGKTREELNTEVDAIRQISKIPYRGTDIDPDMLDHVSEYRRARILEEAQHVYESAATTIEEVLGTLHPVYRKISITLATIWLDQGLYNEAEALLQRLATDWQAKLGPMSRDTVVMQHYLANLLIGRGQLKEGLAHQQAVLEKSISVFGEEHKYTLAAIGNLATTYWNLGQWKEAENLQVKNLDINQRLRGLEHPRTLAAASNLASTYESQGRLQEAAKLKRELLEIFKRVFGEDHSDTLVIMGNLAANYRMRRLWKESTELETKVLAARKRLYGDHHPHTLKSMGNLSSTYFLQGQVREALELDEPFAKAMIMRLGPRHPDALTAQNNLAHTLWAVGRKGEAVEMMEEVSKLRAEVLGLDHVETKRSVGNLSKWRTQA
ncbi:hypothetical protein EDB81DRAFT_858431 [Dactylonectria macrodidyma]|uniref:Protein kinase domain-containing protein n=1 Tax=Dactylonectria macrodidyma TaxID=307937 RepID=A0A9P9IZS4_9HYPO|nr:hypothetical protein EDB81DRAFT_858431 [Dactylonectria macrodidyma]